MKGKGTKTEKLKGGSNDVLNQAVYKYFHNLRSQNIPVSSRMVKEKAETYASEMNIADFK